MIVDELLGEGAFGEVYKGVIRGPLENPKISAVLRQAIGVPVAIKLLKSELIISTTSKIQYCNKTVIVYNHTVYIDTMREYVCMTVCMCFSRLICWEREG